MGDEGKVQAEQSRSVGVKKEMERGKGRWEKWVSRLAGISIFLALLAWTQWAGPGLSSQVRWTGAALVGLVALYTALVGVRAGRANVKLERSYSQHLEQLSERLRHLAYHDSLTGLYNHRYFHDHLRSEFDRAHRYRHPLSVAMLDVNRFKEVNDQYGHLAGDKLLSFLGRLIGENVRSSDIAARYGGDEFAVILPETDGEAAQSVASKIVDAVANRRDWGSGMLANVALQVSAGVATFPQDASSPEELLHEADSALYAAKGREQPVRRRRGFFSRAI